MFRILCGLCALLALAGCVETEAPLDAERELLLSGEDFADYQAPLTGAYAKRVNYGARTIELSYQSEDSDWFYLYSGVSLYPRASDALLTSYAETFGVDVALNSGGLQQQDMVLESELASRISLKLLQDGEPVGNLFAASVGDKSVFAIFTGIHFEDADDFAAFITPKLVELRSYEHADPLLSWAGGKLGFGN